MSCLIRDLENDILENKDILSILRKALLISKRLKLKEFEDWINSERLGYGDKTNLPDYRILDCELVEDKVQGTLTIGGIIRNVPVKLDSQLDEVARKLYLNFSIGEICNLCDAYDDKIRFNAPPQISELLGHPYVYRACHVYQLENVIQQVKDKLLDWCLDLEDQGIFGEDSRFTDDEKNNAKNITLNISANNSQIQIGENNLQVNNENIHIVFEKLTEIKDVLNQYDIDLSEKNEILSKIYIVEDEFHKENSDFNLIENTINSIKRIGESSLAGVTAQLIYNNLDTILNVISSFI